jgi:hypothetical protein
MTKEGKARNDKGREGLEMTKDGRARNDKGREGLEITRNAEMTRNSHYSSE